MRQLAILTRRLVEQEEQFAAERRRDQHQFTAQLQAVRQELLTAVSAPLVTVPHGVPAASALAPLPIPLPVAVGSVVAADSGGPP